jgi:hypothetical protein
MEAHAERPELEPLEARLLLDGGPWVEDCWPPPEAGPLASGDLSACAAARLLRDGLWWTNGSLFLLLGRTVGQPGRT